ncbi:ATP-binding cassette domain-containing protein [Arthrobacter sp. PAMC25564]|uniref:ABC transporter ATP-binding protein n=1 Tax=Arthrobacter sp. PAMC25564 TaxID=2565366 RepID=UPI0010A25DA3|nr:ATP-binding cassette domain-containing protein [Arthrobacter sp. PAMC25564]QCB97982.1 ATP-binding cassette domain-containing protein [Arthrobacter sp. PAMC25564]
MTEATLIVTGLKVAYGITPVLRDVNLSVAPGEVVGLVGPNGAGKSTTLRAISGLVRRQATALTIGGHDVPARPEAAVALGIAHVPEGRGMMAGLTTLENIQVGAIANGKPLSEGELEGLYTLFPRLPELAKRRTGTLSGGEQQMVAIARGLAARPSILMIDELSLGLAPKIVTQLLSSLMEEAIHRRIGILLVDQNVRALGSVCSRMWALRHGVSEPVSGTESQYSDLYFSVR